MPIVKSKENTLFLFFLGILLVLPFFHQQLVVGTLVNALLLLAVCFLGRNKALILGCFPSLIAWSIQLIPSFFFVPWIVLANMTLIVCFEHFYRKQKTMQGMLLGSFAKFFIFVIFLGQTMFFSLGKSQLLTALLGSFVAFSFLKKK